jgi:hypothetical protein
LLDLVGYLFRNTKERVTMNFTREKLYELWYDETKTNTQVAKELGVTLVRLWKLGRAYSLPRRVKRQNQPDPSIEEIHDRAAAIRATWSPEEREQRRVGLRRQRWTPPEFRFTPCGYLVPAGSR